MLTISKPKLVNCVKIATLSQCPKDREDDVQNDDDDGNDDEGDDDDDDDEHDVYKNEDDDDDDDEDCPRISYDLVADSINSMNTSS